MKKSVVLFLVCAAFAAQAETLFYSPASTTTGMNEFGRYIYSAENWTNAQGVAKAPADGDLLILRKSEWLTANGRSGANTTAKVAGFVCEGVLPGVSQGLFHLQSGGDGFVLTNTSGSTSWYCGINLYGSEETPVYCHRDTKVSFQRYFWQKDGGASTVVKRGTGTLQFHDTSAYSPGDRATWKKTRLEAGAFLWCLYGSGGQKYDMQVFPQNHELTFADQGSGVTFSIYDRDCQMDNLTLREASPLAVPNHVITSRDTTNVYLRLYGTPGLNPMGFGGKLTERAGVIWKPDSSDCVFVFSNAVSTTKGGLIVSNGTMRLTNGASFTQLSRVLLASGTSFEITQGSGSGFFTTALELDDATASLTLAPRVVFPCSRATVGGVALADGIYTSSDLAWLKGDGLLLVNTTLPVAADSWWTRETGPTALAANVQTNWTGVHLTGEALTLTAAEDAMVTLGAGGLDTAETETSVDYLYGWPTYLAASQTWQIRSNTTVEVTEYVETVGGCTWRVSGGGSLKLTGAKSFHGDMVVSNATLVATGDESLGGVGGKTTFELLSTVNKGVLRIQPEPGKTEVSFHRPITFHFAVDGEHGKFMYLPADTTVNFYGYMETSIATPHSGPGWPNHWNYDCPASTVVHWYGGMKASLNHKFPGGHHYIHVPLTGGDRFTALGGAVVELLVTGNRIGSASGGVNENAMIYTRAPYALDGRSVNQVLTFTGAATLDLCGNDQALSILMGSHQDARKATVTSADPAVLHITRNQLIDTSVYSTCTNFVRWTGQAGISVERTGTYPVVLMSESSSSGTLAVASGQLVLAKSKGSWPNASAAEVKGGTFTLEHSAALGTNTVVRFTGTSGVYGKMELFPGVKQRVAALVVDGVEQPAGYYGSSASPAKTQRDDLFTGEGVLRVGEFKGLTVILR